MRSLGAYSTYSHVYRATIWTHDSSGGRRTTCGKIYIPNTEGFFWISLTILACQHTLLIDRAPKAAGSAVFQTSLLPLFFTRKKGLLRRHHFFILIFHQLVELRLAQK